MRTQRNYETAFLLPHKPRKLRVVTKWTCVLRWQLFFLSEKAENRSLFGLLQRIRQRFLWRYLCLWLWSWNNVCFSDLHNILISRFFDYGLNYSHLKHVFIGSLFRRIWKKLTFNRRWPSDFLRSRFSSTSSTSESELVLSEELFLTLDLRFLFFLFASSFFARMRLIIARWSLSFCFFLSRIAEKFAQNLLQISHYCFIQSETNLLSDQVRFEFAFLEVSAKLHHRIVAYDEQKLACRWRISCSQRSKIRFVLCASVAHALSVDFCKFLYCFLRKAAIFSR